MNHNDQITNTGIIIIGTGLFKATSIYGAFADRRQPWVTWYRYAPGW